MFLAPKQNYRDIFIVKNFLSMYFKWRYYLSEKSMVKPFYHDLKRKMKITHNLRPIGSDFKNASDIRANIATNARPLQTMGLNG